MMIIIIITKCTTKYCLVHPHDIASYVNFTSDLDKLFGDGSAKYIYKSKSKKCQIKHIFSL